MELRAVEQLAKDKRNLSLDDSRSIVLHANLVAIDARLLNVHPDFRQDGGFFASVDGVVDGFLDGRQ